MTTGHELLAKHNERTRLDAALDELVRLADQHGVAMKLAAVYGNEHGDEDKLRSTRGAMEAVIRKWLGPRQPPR